MKPYTLKNHRTGQRLYEGVFAGMKECVESAVREGMCLDGADLGRANLVNAQMDEASLRGARFAGANLMGANLRRELFRGDR